MAFDRQGNAHLAWQGNGGTGFSIAYRVKSRASGWGSENTLFVGDKFYDFNPAPIVGASGIGNVYVAWVNITYNVGDDLRSDHYDGNQWSGAITLTTDVGGIYNWGALAADGLGVTHLAWQGAIAALYYSEIGSAPPPTPTATPTNTPTNTPTPTPTVTPNAGGLFWLVADCALEKQYQGQYADPRFAIWYESAAPPFLRRDCRIKNGDANAYLDSIALGLKKAFDRYQQLGYLMPTSLPYQVYIVPILGNPAGITFSPQYTFITNDVTGIDGYTPDSLAAHEFFHASQWMYQQACPQINLLQITTAWWNHEDLRWWMEATADWAQQEAIPTDTAYAGPIVSYLNRSWQHMDTDPRPPPKGEMILPTRLCSHFT